MKLFKKNEDDFSEASFNAFEELLLGSKKPGNPVIKGGSMVLYATVAVAVVICLFMAIFDLAGLGPEIPSEPVTQADTQVFSETTEKQEETTKEPADVSAYPESLQKLYKLNPETEDFVLSYDKEIEKQRSVSLRGYKKKNKMPLFLQWDKQWGYRTYGGELAGVTGDGPMCLAMVGYHLTGDKKFSPDKMLEFATEKKFYKKGTGTLPKMMTDGAAELGLTGVQITPSSENIIANLQNGSPLICYIAAGSFTTKGHYVVIHAFEEGYLLINDPFSKINSEKRWLFADIASQIKGIWAISATL